jgi:hypothetical protein
VKKFFVLAGLLALTAFLIAPVTIVPSGGGGAGPGGDAGGTNARILILSGVGGDTILTNVTLLSPSGSDTFTYTVQTPTFNRGLRVNQDNQAVLFDTSGGVSWGPAGGSVLLAAGNIDLNNNVRLDAVAGTANFGGSVTSEVAFLSLGGVYVVGSMTNGLGMTNGGPLKVVGTTLTTGSTNNGSFTNAGSFYNTGSMTNGTGFTNGGPLLVRGTSLLTGGTNNGDYTNSGNIYNNGTLTNGGAANILGGVTNWGAMQTKGTADFAGSMTNESGVNIAGGATNWTQMEVKGTLLANSNLLVNAGQGPANSLSNVWVGGTYFQRIGTAFTNLNGAGTMSNLSSVSITGNTLTNNGDTLFAEWGIKLQITKENTNQFQLLYGATTMLDTGLQIASNCTVRATCTISRTGNASQHVEAHLEWGPGGGTPFAFTNANLEMAENNGIANILKAMGGARAVGAHTNNFFRVEWKPTPR